MSRLGSLGISNTVVCFIFLIALISIGKLYTENYELNNKLLEQSRRLQNCPPCVCDNVDVYGDSILLGSKGSSDLIPTKNANAPWLSTKVKKVWQVAYQAMGYESPITDFEMIQSDINVIKRFKQLPDNFLDIDPDRLVKTYWMDSSSQKGLGFHFNKCINDNLGTGNGIRGLGICVTRGQQMYIPMDGAILYSMIRFFKPKRVLEVGAGFSSGVVAHALRENAIESNTVEGKHDVIEPYRSEVLEKLKDGGINKEHVMNILKEKVQTVSYEHIDNLGSGDILFLDGSHVIQPYGDIIFEFLWLLPRLLPGVIVHVHDIWLPRDYPRVWMLNQGRQYTEQWLLGAFLHNNQDWEIIWPTNHMSIVKGEIYGQSALKKAGNFGGGSFWFRRKNKNN